MQLISVDLAITTTELLIEINVGTADSTRFWAISDLVILARQCDTCPTYELTNTISDIGTITLYTTAIVFPLLIFFFCMVKWESYRRKLKHLTKIGGDTETQSHIPLKVVNRVHSTLSQLTKKV
jgi:rRNA maturation protein Nop10